MLSNDCWARQYDIYIAGPYERALEICAAYCEIGFCVSVLKTCFVYRHGREDGVRVTLINYARFPLLDDDLKRHAYDLGCKLMDGLFQGSFSIIGGGQSIFYSRRSQDQVLSSDKG